MTMRFKLEFWMDNAAFADDPRPETARLLAEVAEKVRIGTREGPVWDENGNKIGFWGISRGPKQDERIDSLV